MNTERVALSDEERHGLWLREHAPIEATYTVVETILAAREQALREEIAGEVERKAQHLNAAEDYGRGGRDGPNAAARIARGDER